LSSRALHRKVENLEKPKGEKCVSYKKGTPEALNRGRFRGLLSGFLLEGRRGVFSKRLAATRMCETAGKLSVEKKDGEEGWDTTHLLKRN